MENSQQIILQSLSMDLLRAALGRHRGSQKMADRFVEEAKKRLDEVKDAINSKLITDINQALLSNSSRQAEDLLMYSTIIRNRSLYFSEN